MSRTITAEQLAGTHIGTRIRLRVGADTVVEDTVGIVRHIPGRALIQFDHVAPGNVGIQLRMFDHSAFEVPHDEQVEVGLP